jgi:hypothetical protein
VTFLSSLLSWANVPFVIALGVAVIFFLLQATGLLGLLAGGGDHDGDADHDVDGGHDADADADGDADGDHDADADGDDDADHDADGAHGNASIGKDLLAGIGVGTMPLSVVWQAFAICFGIAGIAANTVYLGRVGALPTYTLAWTVPIAGAFGYGVNHLLSRLFARIMVPPGKASTSRKDLVGRTGIVISSKVSSEFGEVRTVDKSGDTLRLIVKTLDQDDVIVEGREVVFIEYDVAKDTLYVAALDPDAPRIRPRIRPSAKARVGAASPPAEPPPEDAPVAEVDAAGQDGGSKSAS